MARTSYGIPKKYTTGSAAAWTIDSWRAYEDFPTWAHRGAPNGTTKSEFSWDAYDAAIAAGFVALELSAHRSSDGVWVLNHDATTGSQYTTDVTIASTTWATLQTLTRRYGVTTEPMRRLDATLSRYANYVVFVENKTYANFPEFETILVTADSTKARTVAKHSGDSTSTHAYFHSRGYKTWGYYFGDTGAGGAQNLPTNWTTDMDWVGLSSGPSNNATAQTWFDWCRDRNIPVYAHITRTLADWTTAKGQGAAGMTVNNPALYPLT